MNEISGPAIEPITESDAFIEEALKQASIPTLMMSMIHMSGDTSLMQGKIRPRPPLMNEVQGYLTEEEKAEVRRQALRVIAQYRDSGCKLPSPPPPKVVREMMDFMIGTEVSPDLVPFVLEEMSLDGGQGRASAWSKPVSEAALNKVHVVIIGAGMSGLLAATRLKQAGIPFTVFEKNDGVGGTWYENRYPGCRVDISNHFYSYSFEPSHTWSEYFSRQPELAEYFARFADNQGLRDHIRFKTEISACRYDEAEADWELTVKDANGEIATVRANVVISAVGQLNRPLIPKIEGQDLFQGATCHTASWPDGLDLRGKRVAVIGTGASAFQLVPELAKTAGQLYVFQRSPVWMFPNPDYHATVSDEKKWLLRKLPFYARWYRFLVLWPGNGAETLKKWTIDPAWPHQDRSVSAANDEEREFYINWMKQQVGDNPELLKKVLPDYPPGGKRMLQDNGGWLRALKQPNVELVAEAVTRMDERGIVGQDGKSFPVDVIVFATGFQAGKFLWPMAITGRDGVLLSDFWGDEARAYLGMTMPGFPNFFCLYGPGTNLAHGGSIIFNSECQVRYILGAVQMMIESGRREIEVRDEVFRAFNTRLEDALSKLIWSHPAVHTWYKNAKGKVVNTSPWHLADYWKWTRAPDPADYALR